jgi:hypothetical protein
MTALKPYDSKVAPTSVLEVCASADARLWFP